MNSNHPYQLQFTLDIKELYLIPFTQAMSENNKFLALNQPNSILLYNLQNQKAQTLFSQQEYMECVQLEFTPNGKHLIAKFEDDKLGFERENILIQIWQVERNPKLILQFRQEKISSYNKMKIANKICYIEQTEEDLSKIYIINLQTKKLINVIRSSTVYYGCGDIIDTKYFFYGKKKKQIGILSLCTRESYDLIIPENLKFVTQFRKYLLLKILSNEAYEIRDIFNLHISGEPVKAIHENFAIDNDLIYSTEKYQIQIRKIDQQIQIKLYDKQTNELQEETIQVLDKLNRHIYHYILVSSDIKYILFRSQNRIMVYKLVQ